MCVVPGVSVLWEDVCGTWCWCGVGGCVWYLVLVWCGGMCVVPGVSVVWEDVCVWYLVLVWCGRMCVVPGVSVLWGDVYGTWC